MKRKNVKHVARLLAAVLCVTAGGVIPSVSASVDVNTSTLQAEEFSPTHAVVNDFEVVTDLYELSWYGPYGSFGKADISTDAQYVTSGNSSLRLNPIGDYRQGASPTYLMLPLNRHKEHKASQMTSVSFDVFNASYKDATISCALAIGGTNTKYVDFAVKKGEHKKIELEYDLTAMSAVYDLNTIEGIYVKFPKAENRETQNDNIFYIDNFCAEYTPFELKGYTLTLAENEFCSFDERYHEYLVNTNCGVGSIDGYRPELSINTNPIYCADRDAEDFLFGKNKSLKLVAKAGLSSGNPGFTFADDLWHKFEWSEMDDKALSFDVYNDSEAPFSFSFMIFRNPDNYNTGYYDRYSKSFEIPAYSWATIVLPIKEWNESTKGTNGNKMTSYIQYGKTIYTYQIPFFYYSAAAVGTADRTFYFDNFRIVDVA